MAPPVTSNVKTRPATRRENAAACPTSFDVAI
jgi:hypothetical protein